MLISWNTTKACNLFCIHCYRDAGEREDDELSFDEGKYLLSEIATANFKIVVLSGGEPLMRPDIYELIAYGQSCGLRVVLGTNGTLITREIAQRLKDAGVSRIGISIDSIDEILHDRFRKLPGAYRLAISGISHCKEAGIPFQIHTTVMDFNCHEVEKITDFAVECGASAHHIFFLVATGRATTLDEVKVRGAAKTYEQLLKRILSKQQKINIELKPTCAPQFMRIAKRMNLVHRFSRGCLAGISYACILPNGDLHPCPYLSISAGNIRKVPFTILWQESEVFKVLRSLNYKGRCGICAYREICGGCRARAYARDGDYMETDPWCLYGEIPNTI